jgi:hypothetical protein
MKKSIIAVCIVITVCAAGLVTGWGFWGHQRINRNAVFSLPPELFSFYRMHIDYITVHAVDPDKRRYADPEEAPRHYIDVDRYVPAMPFDSLILSWNAATEKFTEDSLKAHGIVPWHIQLMLIRLTKAFKERDESRILRLSAELGHYVADAHVPLHCTSNYNGQKTGQHGIHGFWESRIPELYGDEFDYLTGGCIYIKNVQAYTWQIIRDSYAAHDSVLRMERDLSDQFPADRKYSYEFRGTQQVKVYSQEYANAYHQKLNGMVERRMRAAIIAVSSYWYTAWVNAGMPQMENKLVDVAPEPADSLLHQSGGSGGGHGHED